MIRTFCCTDTQALFQGQRTRRFKAIERVATRKLQMLHIAKALNDLASPPGNRLEALHGERNGQYSIRINGQWRLCFRWTGIGVEDVEIVDYH